MNKIFEMTQIIDTLPGINHDQIDSIGHRSTRYLKMVGGSIATPPVMRRAPKTDEEVEDIIEDLLQYRVDLRPVGGAQWPGAAPQGELHRGAAGLPAYLRRDQSHGR